MLTNALSAKTVASLKDGKHRDGQGLQFEVKGGSRRWTFSYMFEGRQRELAIGKYPAMSLADARAKRAELSEAKDRGMDPRTVLAGTAVPARPITFRQDMDTYVAHMRGQWTAAPSEDMAAVHGADCRPADGHGDSQADAGRRAGRHQTASVVASSVGLARPIVPPHQGLALSPSGKLGLAARISASERLRSVMSE